MSRMPARFAIACGILALLPAVAPAHSSLGEYVQHRYALAVSAECIELTVELAFNGAPASEERAAMDASGDGVINRDERKAWLGKWEEGGEEQIRLLCNGSAVEFSPQYAPELDLQGDRGMGPHPFLVRLSFFAPTPATLAPGDPLRVESLIKPEMPAMIAVEVGGDPGGVFDGRSAGGILLPALKSGSRSFDVRCPKFIGKPASRRVSGRGSGGVRDARPTEGE